MPKAKRTKLKSKLAHAICHIDRAVIHLADLMDVFAPHHPEFVDYLDAQITSLLLVKEWMLDFWGKAWGGPPENYQDWR